jgi:hypothetical protein
MVCSAVNFVFFGVSFKAGVDKENGSNSRDQQRRIQLGGQQGRRYICAVSIQVFLFWCSAGIIFR